MTKKLILASASPRRRELLKQIGFAFEVTASDADESYCGKEPAEIVKELALRKAKTTAENLSREARENTVVLGADTVVVCDGEILGKPKDEADAFRMIESLQGRAHQVYTGVAVLECGAEGIDKMTVHAEMTTVFVHRMSQEEIGSYIASGEAMDKAGAYGIQGRFAAFIDRIEGDYFNVVGLPAAYVYQTLKNI